MYFPYICLVQLSPHLSISRVYNFSQFLLLGTVSLPTISSLMSFSSSTRVLDISCIVAPSSLIVFILPAALLVAAAILSLYKVCWQAQRVLLLTFSTIQYIGVDHSVFPRLVAPHALTVFSSVATLIATGLKCVRVIFLFRVSSFTASACLIRSSPPALASYHLVPFGYSVITRIFVAQFAGISLHSRPLRRYPLIMMIVLQIVRNNSV